MRQNQIRERNRGRTLTLIRWWFRYGGNDGVESRRRWRTPTARAHGRQGGMSGDSSAAAGVCGGRRLKIEFQKSGPLDIYPLTVGDTDWNILVPLSFLTARRQWDSVKPRWRNRWYRGQKLINSSASVGPSLWSWLHRVAHGRFWKYALVETELRVLLTQRVQKVLAQILWWSMNRIWDKKA